MTVTEEQQLIEASENQNQAQAQEQPAAEKTEKRTRAGFLGCHNGEKWCLVEGDIFNLGL
jgi:hypothetical protein